MATGRVEAKRLLVIGCCLAFTFLLSCSGILQVLGLQGSLSISSSGKVAYPEHELGVDCVDWSWQSIPSEARWVWAMRPEYEKPRENISVILNWYSLHPPWEPSPINYIETEEQLSELETKLKGVPIEKFWGIIFIAEEHYKFHVNFNPDVNTTWFGERLVSYKFYLQEHVGVSEDQWRDEMFLRMIRGFYNYFHLLTKVGITAAGAAIVPNWFNRTWCTGYQKYYGEPAFAFIREHYDFILVYAYTPNLEYWHWTKEYFRLIDEYFPKQKKFFTLTRIWDWNEAEWQPEAMALEIKNALDRKMVLMIYWNNNPPFGEAWELLKRGVQLYDARASYYEEYVEGKNLLTGYVGKTYGWVEV